MSTVTEKLWNDSNTFAFTGSGGAGAGSWATNSNAGWSGGSANFSNTIGDRTVITWTGRSLYLLTAQGSTGADFTVSTDGTTRAVPLSCYGDSQGTVYRAPVCIERGLTDGPHTTILTSIATSANTQTWVNSVLVVSGARVAAVPGVLEVCGDSWSQASGVAVTSGGYPSHVRRRLVGSLGRDLTMTVRGISGAALAGKSTTNAVNAIQQLGLAAATSPEFLSVLFGVNDLATTSVGSNNNQPLETPGMFGAFWRTTLQFIEDVFDITTTKVAVGTPGYISPYYRYSMKQVSGFAPNLQPTGGDVYELGVNAARQAFSEFSWPRVADVYAAMDRRTGLVYPNSNSDGGLHPNGPGHSVVAEEIAHALLSNA